MHRVNGGTDSQMVDWMLCTLEHHSGGDPREHRTGLKWVFRSDLEGVIASILTAARPAVPAPP
jgi:hypothetical protein